jgi:hypothetical protein
MTTQDLKTRLYKIACESLAHANKKAPFVLNQSESMQFINSTRKLIK